MSRPWRDRRPPPSPAILSRASVGPAEQRRGGQHHDPVVDLRGGGMASLVDVRAAGFARAGHRPSTAAPAASRLKRATPASTRLEKALVITRLSSLLRGSRKMTPFSFARVSLLSGLQVMANCGRCRAEARAPVPPPRRFPGCFPSGPAKSATSTFGQHALRIEQKIGGGNGQASPIGHRRGMGGIGRGAGAGEKDALSGKPVFQVELLGRRHPPAPAWSATGQAAGIFPGVCDVRLR